MVASFGTLAATVRHCVLAVSAVSWANAGDEGRDHAPPALARMSQHVAHEVDAAPLPGGAEHLRNSGLDALVRVGDHQFDAPQTAPGELAQEFRPDRLGLGSAYFHAQNLAATIRVDAHGDDDRDGHDAAAAPDLQVGGVDPQIGPVAFDGPV